MTILCFKQPMAFRRLQKTLLTICLGFAPMLAMAADATVSTTSNGLFKMLVGLAIVLLVLAVITWLMKRFMPGTTGQPSTIRVVGGVNVGSRERVVVLEIADRWIVVGVAAGQVSSIANLEIGAAQMAATLQAENNPLNTNAGAFGQSLVPSFAHWLKQSAAKLTEKKDATL